MGIPVVGLVGQIPFIMGELFIIRRLVVILVLVWQEWQIRISGIRPFDFFVGEEWQVW